MNVLFPAGIRKWLKDGGQPCDSLSYGGYGAMLWVRLLAVAAYVQSLAEVECHKLLAMTRVVFELGAGEQSVQHEPRAARFLKSTLIGRGPVNRVVRPPRYYPLN